LCTHPDGLVYCHKLPGGCWLPGAASNTGCEWIDALFAGDDPGELDARVVNLLPTSTIAYPLARTGERFPFASADACGFCVPASDDVLDRYAAHLQGTAFVERLGLAVLDGIANVSGGDVFSTGGGSRSDVWTQCRADVLGRRVHRPACPESAFGSAVLAASSEHASLFDAIGKMVRIDRTFEPDDERAARYGEAYDSFRGELSQRGYL
jgi:xylulokinase